MNTNFKKIKILIFIFLSFSIKGKTQCWQDFFGLWKSESGKFIKLVEYNPERNIKSETVVGDKNNYFEGAYFYEDKISKIINYESQYDEKTKKHYSTKRSFYFKVLRVGKQVMRIRPISEEMIKLFGQNDIDLFNEYFVSFDDFELDSIHYSRMHSPYVLQVDNSGNLKLEVELGNKNKRKKIYKSTLNKEKLKELKKIVIQSQITSVSYCKLNNHSCSDCAPYYIRIYHNGKLTLYDSSSAGQFRGANQLIYYLNDIIQEMK